MKNEHLINKSFERFTGRQAAEAALKFPDAPSIVISALPAIVQTSRKVVQTAPW